MDSGFLHLIAIQIGLPNPSESETFGRRVCSTSSESTMTNKRNQNDDWNWDAE